MLDFFAILSKGGIVLWCFQTINVDYQRAVNGLISNVIVPEKNLPVYNIDRLALHYSFNNELNLFFVAGHQSLLVLTYMKDLLSEVKELASETYKKKHPISSYTDDSFKLKFKDILRRLEGNTASPILDFKKDLYSEPSETTNGFIHHIATTVSEDLQIDSEVSLSKSNSKKYQSKVKPLNSSKTKKPVKEARKWTKQLSKEEEVLLDYSDNKSEVTSNSNLNIRPDSKLHHLSSEYNPKVVKSRTNGNSKPPKESYSSRFVNFFASIANGTILTDQMLDDPLEKVRDHLCAKNVAVDVATRICQSLRRKLQGKSLTTFQTVKSCIMECMAETVRAILTPGKEIDLYNEIITSNTHPYVIVFCGVNGVGKSTNLSKIANWMLQRDLKVSVAACDTFRSGAVEQLKTHVCRLNSLFPSKNDEQAKVQLYEKGYGKDIATVASDAIREAKNQGFDVVLVDTAGRMQDNEPLMRSLSKLIRVNKPNLVLFVGEALVGNDGVDQLQKFNDSLARYSQANADVADPHLIDAIVLTKFDTIDDKVGAALSMTYITGKPILFVGIGQTYEDLIPLNVESVVAPLMS